MPELDVLLTQATGAAVLTLALLTFVRMMWTDRKAERRLDAYTHQLEARVAQLEQQLEHERGRRRTVESAMVAAGVQLPPESPIPTPRESADAH